MGLYKRAALRRPSLLISVSDGGGGIDPSAAGAAAGKLAGGDQGGGRRLSLFHAILLGLAIAAALALLTTTLRQQQLMLFGASLTPRMPTQRYPPSLYVQSPGDETASTRWYVVSAFMDTRPLAFGEPGGVTLVAAGPREEVRKGKSWVASIVRLRGGGAGGQHHQPHSADDRINTDEVARIQCAPTHFVWFDTHPNNSTHSGATIFCADEGAWSALQNMHGGAAADAALGVCLMSDAGSMEGCVPRSVVPISLPFNYPNYPTAWGAALLRDTFGGDGDAGTFAAAMMPPGGGFRAPASQPAAAAAAGAAAAASPTTTPPLTALESSLKGEGDIAMCISPISSGIYTSTLRFFLQYYGQMGVDHVYMYMRRPSDTFRALVEGMVDEQRLMNRIVQDDTPTLELVPWCLQQDATYGCAPGQHKLEPGFFNVAASNFGQILQIQDCFLRAMGRFRWMLTVDLDEYIVPHVPYIQNLHDMIASNVLREPSGRAVAPSEIRFQTAFFEPCFPGDDDRALMSQQAQDAFFLREPESYPRPIWAGARVSEMFDPVTRSKFMCDTLTCDRVGIHFGFTTLCDRFKGRAAWPMACTGAPVYEISTDQVLIHHTRAQFAADAVLHKCSEHPKKNVTDWTFANFIFGQRIRAQVPAGVGRGKNDGGGGGGGGDGGGGIEEQAGAKQQQQQQQQKQQKQQVGGRMVGAGGGGGPPVKEVVVRQAR